MKCSLHFTFHKLAQCLMTCKTASKFTFIEKTSLNKLSFIVVNQDQNSYRRNSAFDKYGKLNFSIADIYLPI